MQHKSEEKEKYTEFWLQYLKARNHLEDLGVGGG
jgi:hypothetical protein